MSRSREPLIQSRIAMNILHLEDNPRDAELAHLWIREEWPQCRIDLVDNRQAFVAQLARAHDVVLSDFSMVTFNGLEALRLTREREPDMPFIFLSGTIGEDRALEALRAGATDYLIKDRPKRLIHSIQRALRETKLHRERRAASEQMLRVQRLENIGMLAAGIAHDFNNVLAPMLMGISLLRSRTKSEADERILATIENSAERGAGLIRQILGFAHGVTGEMQILQPKHMLRELVDMMEQTFPKSIRVSDAVESGLWPIKANPTQLHQVLLNLCVNARDAMPRGGTLTIRASNCELGESEAAGIHGGRPGNFLRLQVEDTGTGISGEIIDRIWEPFFTTKEEGQGTGLGLSTVRSIVESHQGGVALSTEMGRGTVFQIFLPAEPPEEIVPRLTGAWAVPRGTGELIVVADDDVNVRDITAATLSNHGYHVLAAANGTEAVALIAPRCLEVRGLVTDLDMPELDGLALTKVVASLNPAIRVLLISASSSPEDPRRTADVTTLFLAKPFSAEKLLSSVHKLLHTSAVAGG
jgi:two-component system cell cycle sensor histidine kinase/response regulator CckA